MGRDLFADYYALRKQGRLKEAPHYRFANCGDDAHSIEEFTVEYGVFALALHSIETNWDIHPGFDWAFRLEDWRQVQGQFRRLLSLGKNRTTSALRKLAEEIHRFRGSVLPVGTSPRIAVKQHGQIQMLMEPSDLWSAFCDMLLCDLSVSGRVIRECADPKCGMFFPADRVGKKFCDANCGARFHKRKWYRKYGRANRAQARKRDSS